MADACGETQYYHKASDTMEKLDFCFMAELVESLVIFFRSHH
ncbi:hypothetical protein [Desulfonema magnum]|uniref:Uncharacterized protein n=1 Tax=Desulfonema magnum TaxID=45655 RepID=A0A975GPK0_9BACT|nr:hypothetical protein [Desulfonema magnum]QTA88875.1 Uncharacterized protein dnm_049220 [Desulfonema magnum]